MRKRLLTVINAIIVLMVLYFACSCCSARYNLSLTDAEPVEHATSSSVHDDQTLMYACFSGGGTRAMAMGYEVVNMLAKVPYKVYITGPGSRDTTSLRDEIDYTSGVSGGAFVSAALAVYPQKEWSEFYRVGVSRNIQGSIIRRLLAVKNWPRLLSPYYNRTDLASEFYDRRVFKRMTIGQLPVRPVVYLNTTVLAVKSHLVFTDEYFRYIGSDINSYPVGFACAASSAFPGGFAPMTLKNYNTKYLPEDSLLTYARYRLAVANSQSDIEQRNWAQMYRFFKDTTNRWLHVSDGGIAGNTGIERVLDDWHTNGVISRAINDPAHPIKRLIIVVVNSGTDKPDESCFKRRAPNTLKTILYTTTTAMDLLSQTRTAQLKARVDELWTVIQQSAGHDPSLAQLEKPYLIEVNARNLKNRQLRDEFDVIPTSFDLPDSQLRVIKQVVSELLSYNSEYQRLLQAVVEDNIKNKH